MLPFELFLLFGFAGLILSMPGTNDNDQPTEAYPQVDDCVDNPDAETVDLSDVIDAVEFWKAGSATDEDWDRQVQAVIYSDIEGNEELVSLDEFEPTRTEDRFEYDTTDGTTIVLDVLGNGNAPPNYGVANFKYLQVGLIGGDEGGSASGSVSLVNGAGEIIEPGVNSPATQVISSYFYGGDGDDIINLACLEDKWPGGSRDVVGGEGNDLISLDASGSSVNFVSVNGDAGFEDVVLVDVLADEGEYPPSWWLATMDPSDTLVLSLPEGAPEAFDVEPGYESLTNNGTYSSYHYITINGYSFGINLSGAAEAGASPNIVIQRV